MNSITRTRPNRSPRSVPLVLAMFGLACLLIFSACRSAAPSVAPLHLSPSPTPTAQTPEAVPVVVPPSSAVTNSLHHVTYTFDLPRPPARGYVIEESIDGQEWIVYGRSSSTNLRQVTLVDATPNSGKQWRVTLP